MKASFASCIHREINSSHIHHAHLAGQLVAIDCDRKKEPVRVDLYKKGEKSYYCCIWIRGWADKQEVDITGSGKANSRFGAVYAALDSADISFEHPLPELGSNFDIQVWDKLEYVFTAIAEAAGAERPYIHHCMRSN
jgi:hypothetical protein